MYSKSWILTSLPPSIAPYVELTRVGYLPAGVLISYLPVLVPLLHVATISHLPANTVLDASLKWLLLCFNYSAYGCVVDDLADVDLDRKVERCQHRPLVRGAVSVTQGMLFAATLAASALTLTTTFFPNQPATHVPIAIAGSILYPFLKRWTNYALLFLALLYVSTGLNASRTLGFDILSLPSHSSLLHSNLLLNGAIYIANITVETIYMHADVEDDIKSGINSLAVRMYGYSKPVLSLMALAYGGLVLSSGFTAGFGVWYFSAAAVSAAILLGIVAKVDLKDGKQCEVYFFGGNAIVMATLAAGLWGEYQYGRVALAASAAAVL